MPYVETATTIAAPARIVYELAKEQERFPEFMPDVEIVVVLERHPDRVVTRWKTLVEEAPIEWIEEDRFDDERLRIDYKLIEGDLDKFEGAWTFIERDGATHVNLGVDYDFGVPTLAELIGPTLQKKVVENSEMMLAALKKKPKQSLSTQSRNTMANGITCVWGAHPSSGDRVCSTLSRNTMASVKPPFWGAHGERVKVKTFKRPMAWGPHEVGGAEPEAKRPSTAALACAERSGATSKCASAQDDTRE